MFSLKMTALSLSGAVLLSGASAFADGDEEEHFDIGVWNDNGTLMTGGWDHDTESMEVSSLRVFEAHFGEDKEFPYAIDEPGIGGVAADVGLALGDNILLSLASGISVWNGSGFSSSSTEMTVGFGPNTVSSNGGGDLSFTVTEDYDYHPIFSIAETSAVGSYLLQFSVSVDGLTSSDPFWIVFNQGMDDELYEESVEWVEGNLVPAPGAIGLLAMAGLASSRRRRN